MNKEKTKRVLDYFEELYPDAHCELNHRNVFELLVAVMLSAQTTDKKVNQVTPGLFEKYPKVSDLANASLEELQDQIKVIGLYRNKAKNLKAMAQELVENYQGEVPCTRKELESLPGVGRKTTNVVLSVGFNVPAFAVDTHVERISKRLGFAKKDDTVQDVVGIRHIINLFSLDVIFVRRKIQTVKNVIFMICVRKKESREISWINIKINFLK